MYQEVTAYKFVPSQFGQILLVWHRASGGAKVVRIVLPAERKRPDKILSEKYPGAKRGSHPAMGNLIRNMEDFLRGRRVSFSLDLLDFEVCSRFQRRVLMAEFQVPRGRVTTYGHLAGRIGAPGAARAVGNALAGNPFPLIIPCHRCIREDGHLGGFRGGLAMKRALLEMEGIVFDRHSRVLRTYIG